MTGCTFSGNLPCAVYGGNNVAAGLRSGTSALGFISLENCTFCGTADDLGGLIHHIGGNNISDCIDNGDLNGDGAIDSTDLDAMHAAVGICKSDVNHDGNTNVLDLLDVIDEWGGVCP